MKLLIADDSRGMRMILKRQLREAGYGECEIIEAGNGKEALAAIQASPPDLVLSDWNMPEMSGIQLLEALKKENLSVRLGFVTSSASPEVKQMATGQGALFVIAKPFTAETLKQELDSVFSQSATSTASGSHAAVTAPAAATGMTPGKLAEVLGGLLPRGVTVIKAAPMKPGTESTCLVASYVTAKKKVAAVVVCQLKLAASAGAALTLFPATLVKDAVAAGKLADKLLENTREVLNVLAGGLAFGDSGSLTLSNVFQPGGTLTPGAAGSIKQPKHRVDVEVQIASYDSGFLSIFWG